MQLNPRRDQYNYELEKRVDYISKWFILDKQLNLRNQWELKTMQHKTVRLLVHFSVILTSLIDDGEFENTFAGYS